MWSHVGRCLTDHVRGGFCGVAPRLAALHDAHGIYEYGVDKMLIVYRVENGKDHVSQSVTNKVDISRAVLEL